MIKVFIDMDGVLADFVGGLCTKFEYKDAWPNGEYDVCKVIGQNVWPHLDHNFWVNLPKTDEADEIIKIACQYDYYICTAPTLDPYSAAGKLIWLGRFYPIIAKARRFVITPHKHLLAKGNILIDDSDEQIRRWREAGGNGVIIPRPWNAAYGLDPMLYAKKLTMAGAIE